tara:strand:+ start:1695 stop:2294 length:600 start_codon:yes stop_codon:yes gene_type:complete
MNLYSKNILFIFSILFLLFAVIQFVDKTCFRLRENMGTQPEPEPEPEPEPVPEETTDTLISQTRFYSDVSEDMDYCNSLKLMQVFIKNPQGDPNEKETIYDGLTNSTPAFNLPCNDTGVSNNYCDDSDSYYLAKYANKHPWLIGIDVNDSNNKNIRIDDVNLTSGKVVTNGSNKQIQWDIPVNPPNDKKCNFKYGFNII